MTRLKSPRPLVFLVEADEAVRTALRFALEVDGYAVETFPDAESLLDCTGAARPDCIIAEVDLPGLDGLTLVRTLRRRRPELPALLIATNPGRPLRQRVAAAGLRLVEKPLLGEILADAIADALARPRLLPV